MESENVGACLSDGAAGSNGVGRNEAGKED